jgi:hypothetical protein
LRQYPNTIFPIIHIDGEQKVYHRPRPEESDKEFHVFSNTSASGTSKKQTTKSLTPSSSTSPSKTHRYNDPIQMKKQPQ